MKLQDLPGWPPAEFECSEQPAFRWDPEQAAGLRIEAVSYVPGNGRPGDLILVLVDQQRSVECTARLKLADKKLAIRALDALKRCKGLTIAQAGLRLIPT